MSSNDSDAIVDFRLVQTYTPAMLLLMRAVMMLCIYASLVVSLSVAPIHTQAANVSHRVDIAILVLACWVYFDAWFFRHDTLSRTAGFLAPPLLLILTMSDHFYPHTRSCSDIVSLVVYYATGILWATSCSFCVIDMLLRMQTRFNIHIASAAWAVACIVLMFVDCRKKGVPELLARTLLYYLIVIVLYFSQTLQPDRERNRFAFGILHTSIHVLFADSYVVAGSVIILFCVFVYYFNVHRKPAPITRNLNAVDAKPKTEVPDSLLKELQAAKRAQVSVV
tara:strand:+ start:24365 stop:25204 length:840 start_codon:yes stop_codon:yes gene_type:complete